MGDASTDSVETFQHGIGCDETLTGMPVALGWSRDMYVYCQTGTM